MIDIITRTGGYPVVGVHRGGYVENTIEGFREAVRCGARLLEIDIRMTRDKHLVLMHDSTVDRTTDGQGAVNEFLLEELLQLDAAYQHPTLRNTGIRVATFDEFMKIFVPMKDLLFLFDFKEYDVINKTLPLLEQYNIDDRYILGSVFEECNHLLQRKRRFKHIPITSDITQTFHIFFSCNTPLWRFCTLEHDIIDFILLGPTIHFFTRDAVRAIHERGAKVLVCGEKVNTKEWFDKCIEFGVDYILVDDFSMIPH